MKKISFFYRVFSTVEKNIWANELETFLKEKDLTLDMIGVVEEDEQENTDAEPFCLIFMDSQDREVASLSYDRIDDTADSSDEEFRLKDEIDEFHGLVDEMGPEVNRAWVHEQLDKTVGCYAFEIKQAGFEEENWAQIAEIAEWLRNETEGFEQSDGGQITNEAGAVVLAVPDDADEYDEDDYDDEDFEEEDELDESDDEDDELEFDDDGEWEDFVAAVRSGNAWVEKTIKSEEELTKFINGEN